MITLSLLEGQKFKIHESLASLFHFDEKFQVQEIFPERFTTCEVQEKIFFQRDLSLFTKIRPTSSKLPINYQLIPPWVRMIVANTLGRMQRRREKVWADYPSWPIDLSYDLLTDLFLIPSIKWRNKTSVIISHDLDSLEGLKNYVELFMPIENHFGVKSSNYIVPCGWPLDYSLMDKIKKNGHELGTHGFNHENKTYAMSLDQIEERVVRGLGLLKDYNPRGYRAPSLLRSKAMFDVLKKYYLYDSSVPTSGGPFPVPNNGLASARPFQYADSFFELPLSLPRDGSLLFLGYSADEILNLWIECTELIRRTKGVVVLLNHCEKRFSGNKKMLGVFQRYLNYVAKNDQFEFTTAEKLLESIAGY